MKINLKTLVIIIVLISMLFILTGCSNDGVSKSSDYKVSEDETQKVNNIHNPNWVDLYCNAVIKEKKENEYIAELMDDVEIQFIQIKGIENPVMIKKYIYNKITLSYKVYWINEDKTIGSQIYSYGDNNFTMKLQLLKSKRLNEYRWYFYQESEVGYVSYRDIYELINEEKKSAADSNYWKTEESKNSLSRTTINIGRSDPYESYFEEPKEMETVEVVKVKDYTNNESIKDGIVKASKVYKELDEIVTENEEDSAEISEDKFEVGQFYLEYGLYKCQEFQDTQIHTYTINKDGTFSMEKSWKNVYDEEYKDSGKGTYRVYFSEGDWYDSTQSWIIEFKYTEYHSTYEPINKIPDYVDVYDVSQNNTFQYRQSVGTFKYEGK